MKRRGILKTVVSLAALGGALSATSGLALARGGENATEASSQMSAQNLANADYYTHVSEIASGMSLSDHITSGSGRVTFRHNGSAYRIETEPEMWNGHQPSINVRVYQAGSESPISDTYVPLDYGGTVLTMRELGFEIRVTQEDIKVR